MINITILSLNKILESIRGSDSAYPTGLAPSEAPTALILQDWHHPRLRQRLSYRIDIIRGSDSAYPTGLAPSEIFLENHPLQAE